MLATAPYIQRILDDLLNEATNMNGKVFVPYEQVRHQLQQIQDTSVRWDTDDFRTVAEWQYPKQWELHYDASCFEHALHIMIEEHDAETGINWETVKYYLNTYCRHRTGHALEVMSSSPYGAT